MAPLQFLVRQRWLAVCACCFDCLVCMCVWGSFLLNALFCDLLSRRLRTGCVARDVCGTTDSLPPSTNPSDASCEIRSCMWAVSATSSKATFCTALNAVTNAACFTSLWTSISIYAFILHMKWSRFRLYLLMFITFIRYFHTHIYRHTHASTHVWLVQRRIRENQAQEPGWKGWE